MDSKEPNRRRFLKGGAALAGVAAGDACLASAQTQGTPTKKIDELIAYGERSRFVSSVRVPVAERHSPDEFGLTFHILAPLSGLRRHHHAICQGRSKSWPLGRRKMGPHRRRGAPPGWGAIARPEAFWFWGV